MTTRHAPRVSALALAALLGVGAGCQPTTPIGTAAGYGDPLPAPYGDPQIAVLADDLRPWLGFQPAGVVADGRRPMAVDVPVRNLADDQYLVEYRMLFYDGHGMEVAPVMGWQMVAIEPKQTARLVASALDTRAEPYRVEVRWAQ